MISLGKTTLALVAAGWLAEALASTHADIDAGVAAYKAGDSDAALERYTAAEADLGERPEIHFNKGLALLARGDKDDARKAFERGTESDNAAVHASAEYELGNLELDAEAFDAAIERYIKCLKLNPEHASAKWNLELALLKKQQKEDEEKKKQEEQDKDKQDEEKKDEDKDKQDEQKKDEGEDKKDEDKKDEEKKDEGEDKKEEDKKPEGEDKKDEDNKPEDNKPEDKPEDKQQDEPKGQQPQPQPQPLDKADLDRALQQLDEEDQFQLGRPQGRQVPVEKDW